MADALAKFEQISGDRKYKTTAYDRLEEVYESGWCDNFMSDKFDRHQIINFLIPIIRREERMKNVKTDTDK